MLGMIRVLVAVFCLLVGGAPGAAQEKPAGVEAQPVLAHFDYRAARSHELKPHRRTVPLAGLESGFNQLHLTLTVSPAGDVVDAKAEGDEKEMERWPEVAGEVKGWKFRPFEAEGKPVTVEEYLDLVPPERLPKVHVEGPKVGKESKIAITLERTGCLGSCPSYKVTVTQAGVVFEGGGFVVAGGEHKARVDASAVRGSASGFRASSRMV